MGLAHRVFCGYAQPVFRGMQFYSTAGSVVEKQLSQKEKWSSWGTVGSPLFLKLEKL
jgi:hypothetical protein